VGQDAGQTVKKLTETVGKPVSGLERLVLQPREVLLWQRDTGEPGRLRARESRAERRRHRRKYAEGNLPAERSFYFRGPEGKLNLRVQNLMLFLQIANGVDDDTWEHHLRKGDYSRWFREGIKDETLAAEAERVERLPHVKPAESRALIKAAIERDYTLPASAPLPVPGAE